MDSSQIRSGLEDRFLQNATVIAAFVVGVLIVTCLRDYLIYSSEHPEQLWTGLTLLFAAFLLGALQLLYRPARRFPYQLSTALILCLVARKIASLYHHGDVSYAITTSFLLIAYSMFVLSYRWLLVVVVATAVAWLPVALASLALREVAASALALLVAVGFSYFTIRNRIRFHTESMLLQDRVRMLETLLPVCSDCRKIRNSDDQWVSLEQYADESLNRPVTHSICESCINRRDPDFSESAEQPSVPGTDSNPRSYVSPL
jgi:hypothetical protein